MQVLQDELNVNTPLSSADVKNMSGIIEEDDELTDGEHACNECIDDNVHEEKPVVNITDNVTLSFLISFIH